MFLELYEEIKYALHSITHLFRRRELVWEMVDGGGACFGLACPSCGEVEWIDYYRGIEMRKQRGGAIHTNEFYEYYFPFDENEDAEADPEDIEDEE